MRALRSVFLFVFSWVAVVGTASAAVFPDVPDGHIYQQPIELLVHSGVVGGNPDGTFAPDRVVNRAEMLKMLYKAKGRNPDPLSIRCFHDVGIDSWYEPYVCDAAARRYVNGYADGTFRPGDPVNRVEALKMITTVFELPLEEITEQNRDVVNFVDVSLSAWYTRYLYTSYVQGILPVAGQEGSRFYPDWALLRGEAAAYIYNALKVDLNQVRQRTEEEQQSSAAVEQQGTAASARSSVNVGNTGTTAAASSSQAPSHLDDTFPFSHSGKFNLKKPFSYRFDINSPETISVTASLQSGQPGKITCRLYLLGTDGFSDQYFLGYEEGNSCYILASLNTGEYQLQLSPSVKDTTYSVTTATATGDGNDGFRDAKLLSLNLVHTETLAPNDIADWYRFSLSSKQKMTVHVTNSPSVDCFIYPMSDVDLESFTMPECNHSYEYPPGTYYIAVGRKANKAAQQTYTIRLDK